MIGSSGFRPTPTVELTDVGHFYDGSDWEWADTLQVESHRKADHIIVRLGDQQNERTYRH